MLALELISDVLQPLKPTDTVSKALERLNEFKVFQLPLVSGTKFLGMLSEEELQIAKDPSISIANFPFNLIKAFVREDTHVFDVIKIINEMKLSTVPVLDAQQKYLGCFSVIQMVSIFAETSSIKEPGGILVLGISNRDNSMSHMAQIVESDNAQIISSHVRSFADSTRMEVTLKINRTELSSLIAAFERYGYEVIASYNHVPFDDGNSARYDSFMNYLNV
ncbi:MAG: CBS domain-containing protein [Pedobacter sp.]|nr:MAG: CBS domain-containing protein [Pedobacter sp.]